jgi:hypothetical protein
MTFRDFYRLMNESVLKRSVALIGVETNSCTFMSDVHQYTEEEAINSGLVSRDFISPTCRQDVLELDVSGEIVDIYSDADIQHAIERAITLIMDMVIDHNEEDSLTEHEVSHKLREGFKPFYGQDLKGWWIGSSNGFFGIVLDQNLTHLKSNIRDIRNTEDISGLEDLF